MKLPILKYGHPTLRKKGARVEAVTPHIVQLAKDMMETMYDAHGVGLAAQQVGEALQLAVLDVREATDRPSTLAIDGREVDVDKHMPMVLINPRLNPSPETLAGPEGCLSFPELYGEVVRPASVEVEALDANGQKIRFRAGGLLGRAIQHEIDHLNGILFIDRMTADEKAKLKLELTTLQAETKAALSKPS